MIKSLIPLSHKITKFGLRLHQHGSYDEELTQLFNGMKKLKFLTLENICENFEGTCLLALSPEIEDIFLAGRGSIMIKHDILKTVLKKSANLEKIVLSETENLVNYYNSGKYLFKVEKLIDNLISRNG